MDIKVPRTQITSSRPGSRGKEIRPKVGIMISTIMAQTAMILCRKLEFKENCSAGRVVSVGF